METIINEVFGTEHPEFDDEVRKLYQLLKNTDWAPIYLPRFFEDSSEIGVQLAHVLALFDKQVVIYGVKQFQELLTKKKNELYSFTPYPEQIKYAQIAMINQSYAEYFFNLDEQAQQPTSKMGVYKKYGIEPNDEGLVPLDSRFDTQKDGLVFKEDVILYYSPFLRRYFSGRFTELTELISKLSKKTKVLVSLDHERSMKGDYIPRVGEFDHWWGPFFDIDKFSDPYFEETIVYGRSDINIDDITKLPAVYPIIRTEFRIKNIEPGIKQIEIEEVTPFQEKRKLSEQHHFQRYIHAYWEPDKQMFSHFDLAIQVYNKTSHEMRVQHPWKDKSGSKELSKRYKLLRIDNYLSYQEAVDIIAYFCRGNELIHQFFSGTNSPEEYLAHYS